MNGARNGSLRRSFRLPENADIDRIAASFETGVLKGTIRKAAGGGVEPEKKVEIAVKQTEGAAKAGGSPTIWTLKPARGAR